MTADEVFELARQDGFELVPRIASYTGDEVLGWRRYGDDDRWPCYLEERQALNWMRDRLRREGVFT